ncbi:hypothetical protein NHX12_007364 [Muraenolepis orangiensis]|uniref:Uncharacterized protein n=1 Tax=Muraenolepis orangiensis TaxID=630683 RepID=A0A9Q0DPR7_9TELE|nr:hypothetical protein NHX12_007364 [Muraenolepis orangiensis]
MLAMVSIYLPFGAVDKGVSPPPRPPVAYRLCPAIPSPGPGSVSLLQPRTALAAPGGALELSEEPGFPGTAGQHRCLVLRASCALAIPFWSPVCLLCCSPFPTVYVRHSTPPPLLPAPLDAIPKWRWFVSSWSDALRYREPWAEGQHGTPSIPLTNPPPGGENTLMERRPSGEEKALCRDTHTSSRGTNLPTDLGNGVTMVTVDYGLLT